MKLEDKLISSWEKYNSVLTEESKVERDSTTFAKKNARLSLELDYYYFILETVVACLNETMSSNLRPKLISLIYKSQEHQN